MSVTSPSPTDKVMRQSRLWHAPINADHSALARAGESWTTRCGIRVKRSPMVPRKRTELAPMERCVVCCTTGESA